MALICACVRTLIWRLCLNIPIATNSMNSNLVLLSAAKFKMEIPVLVRPLKSSILSLTSHQMDKTFWEVVSAAAEQSKGKANTIAWGHGKFGPWGWPQNPSKPKKNLIIIFFFLLTSQLTSNVTIFQVILLYCSTNIALHIQWLVPVECPWSVTSLLQPNQEKYVLPTSSSMRGATSS